MIIAYFACCFALKSMSSWFSKTHLALHGIGWKGVLYPCVTPPPCPFPLLYHPLRPNVQIMVWNLDSPEQVIKNPVKTISLHTDMVLSMSFNTDGSRLATSCKDRKIRIIDPRTGALLQVCPCVACLAGGLSASGPRNHLVIYFCSISYLVFPNPSMFLLPSRSLSDSLCSFPTPYRVPHGPGWETLL